MRTSARSPSLRGLAAGALALLGAASVLASACGTDAVGVEACRRIERFRCKSAPVCLTDWTEEDVTSCEELYRDQCLHGVENAEHSPGEAELDGCIDAINATVACRQAGVKEMSACAGVVLATGVSPATDTCTPIVQSPELLAACAFIATPVAATPAPDAGGGGGS